MSTEHFDVVVVGGGIHGVGVAQAVAAAGHSVLVIEKTAIAAGTSSKSSKLIHGGLRYLESYQFRLVAECLRERWLLLELAPDLVKLRPFHIPVYSSTRRGPAMILAGLSLYATLGRFAPGTGFGIVRKRNWENLDGLRTGGLRAVFRYQDAQTDDRLLSHAVMNSALGLGAQLAMPATFTAAELLPNGVAARFSHGDHEHEVTATVMVNAGGPWSNDVLARVRPVQKPRKIDLVQGSHLTLDWHCERGMYYLESPRDGRAIFVMPRNGHTFIGTTELPFNGSPDNVQATDVEKRYLLSVLQFYFPQFRDAGDAIVRDAWAGLRVLPAGEGHAFHRPRETLFYVDQAERPRILTIYGGKLTAYRATAEKVVERLERVLPSRRARASTRELRLYPPDGVGL